MPRGKKKGKAKAKFRKSKKEKRDKPKSINLLSPDYTVVLTKDGIAIERARQDPEVLIFWTKVIIEPEDLDAVLDVILVLKDQAQGLRRPAVTAAFEHDIAQTPVAGDEMKLPSWTDPNDR